MRGCCIPGSRPGPVLWRDCGRNHYVGTAPVIPCNAKHRIDELYHPVNRRFNQPVQLGCLLSARAFAGTTALTQLHGGSRVGTGRIQDYADIPNQQSYRPASN